MSGIMLVVLIVGMLLGVVDSAVRSDDHIPTTDDDDDVDDGDSLEEIVPTLDHTTQNPGDSDGKLGKTTLATVIKSQLGAHQAAMTDNFTWPYRDQVAVIEGNITLGGLMMVHERDEAMVCGKIMAQGGVQASEAMLYTVRWVNEHGLIPGVTLGARIKDDCDRDIYGLEQSVHFIRGSVSKLTGSTQCQEDRPQMIAGVVAAPSSVTSIQVANLLKLFKIPQVSFFSTSSELSSDDRYPFFLRTIPSDKNQAEAMVELVKLLNWTFVSVVYEESNYGRQGYSDVLELLTKEGICTAVTVKMTKDSGVAVSAEYDRIVERLNSEPSARGVIVFGSDQEVAALMRAVERNNLTGHFTWIGSDGWGGRTLVSDGNEAQVEGAVTVQPFAAPVQGFEDYFLNLTPSNNPTDPWFTEYWEDYFQCRVNGSLKTPFNQEYTRMCTGSERMTRDNGYAPEAQLQFVSDAVMAFAVALKNMHEDLCGGYKNPGICAEMDPYDGQLLLRYLLRANFTGLSGEDFHFLSNGDVVPRYRILHFRQMTPGKYEWITVGQFTNSTLTVRRDKLQFHVNHTRLPVSICSAPCGPTEAQQFVGGHRCCWTCIPCTGFQYLATRHECAMCPLGSTPSVDRKQCLATPEMRLAYDDTVGVVAMSLAGLGVLVTLYVIAVFIRYRDTPVVKASGRELSYVLLAGILLCYGLTFLIIARPTHIVCGAQKFGIGFCFSVCYGALLTKTNRIARIFQAGKRTVKRPKFISPQSQLVICASLVGVQVMVGVLWLMLSPPQAGHYYPRRDVNHFVCLSAVGASYMVGLAYPILLIIVCTVYAVLTRAIPESFNESKYIGLTMYTTCVIWLAFVPIYFSTADRIEIRLAVLCFSISLSATVALVCLFAPKLYIIILHPERNVRQSMMTSKMTSSFKSSGLNSSFRADSGTQSDGDIELRQRLYKFTSPCRNFTRSHNTTQTATNGHTISTQTLDSISHDSFEDMDVQL